MKKLLICLICLFTIVQAQFKKPELSSKYATIILENVKAIRQFKANRTKAGVSIGISVVKLSPIPAKYFFSIRNTAV